jgi:hypothetical protein
MNRELGLLNFICVVAALLFLVLIVINAITSGDLLSTDNLFVSAVGLVMALMFAVNPLLYLKSEGKLPLPFSKRSPPSPAQISGTSSTPPLLDAKGRVVPPDVRAIISQMGQAKTKDA